MNAQNNKDKLDELIILALTDIEKNKAKQLMETDIEDTYITNKTESKIKKEISSFFAHKYETKPPKIKKRTLIVLVAAIVLAIVLCISVSGIRNRILNAVFSDYDEYNSYKYDDNALVDRSEKIEEYKQPTFIPFELEGNTTIENEFLFEIMYKYNEKRYIVYSQCKQSSEPLINVNNENCFITEEIINDCEGQMYSYANGCFELMWIDEDYLYTITSTIEGMTKEEIIKMAESVK